MAKKKHLRIIRQGVEAWNRWREDNRKMVPDLTGADLADADLADADLFRADLSGADLSEAILARADLSQADLSGADLSEAYLNRAILARADLSEADLSEAYLSEADLSEAYLSGANLGRAILSEANLVLADLSGADLSEAYLSEANLSEANLTRANLSRAILSGANLTSTQLTWARLNGADLSRATLVETRVERADFSGTSVYGTAVWNLEGSPTDESDLLITPPGEPAITVDDLKVAQFVYLLLNNPNIRDVIDTIGAKGVLILGRFTNERKEVLDKLRKRLRELGFAPMVFDFEKPTSKDFTETVKTLAGMSAFIIADITAPRSVPQEAQAIIPDYMVPFIPLIEVGEEPWAMFEDLWARHDWVFEPLKYSSVDELIPRLDNAVVKPALEMRKVLLARRAEEMGTRSLDEFELDNE